MFSTLEPLKRHLLVSVAAAGFCFVTYDAALAGQCGCQANCQISPHVSSDGCSCQCSRGAKRNCLHQALGVVAGGFEKLLSLGKCGSRCDQAGCDDACDAAMMEELMMPVQPPTYQHNPLYQAMPPHSTPMYQHAAPMHLPYTSPNDDVRFTPSAPSDWENAGQRMLDAEVSQPAIPSRRLPAPVDQVSPPARMPVPDQNPNQRDIRQSQPATDGGSLFDTLSDPFSDDEARVHSYRPVRPSSYSRPLTGSSTTSRPLSRSSQTSSRRSVNSFR